MQNNQSTAKQMGNKIGETANKISDELKNSGFNGLAESVDRVGEKLGAVKDTIVDHAEAGFEEISEASKKIYKEGTNLMQKVESFIKERPILSSAIALGFGVIITTLLSNKKEK